MEFLTKPVIRWIDDKKVEAIKEIIYTDKEEAVNKIKKLRNAHYIGFFGRYLYGYVQQVEDYGIKDLKKAIKSYNDSILQGDVTSFFNLALIYRELGDIKKEVENYEEGFYWGSYDVSHNFGCCYYYGYGVEKSLTMAHYAFSLSEREESKDLLKQIDLGNDYILPSDEDKIYIEKWSKLDYDSLLKLKVIDNQRLYYRYLGQRAYNEQKYKSAFNFWIKAIELKDVESMYLITSYYGKRPVPDFAKRNSFESFYYSHINYWLERAVKFNHKGAIMKLASRVRELDKAVGLYELLASKGDLDAVEKIGLLYLDSATGNYYKAGVKSHFNKAAYYFKKLLEANDPRGYYNLAKIYLTKDYDEYNVDKAFELLNLAADNNDPEAIMTLADYYCKGYYVEKNEKIARQYFDKAMELGYIYSSPAIGIMNAVVDIRYNQYTQMLGKEAKELFDNGQYEESFKLHEKCAKLNNNYKEVLAKYYIKGLYVEQDVQQAIKLLSSCYGLSSNYELGEIYFNGIGIDKDYAKALYYYKKAYSGYSTTTAFLIGNNPVEKEAMYKCGCIYLNGFGVDQNINEAVKYFKGGADKGHDGCKYYLGLIYSTNEYGLFNKELANKYLTESAENNYMDSMILIGKYLYEGTVFSKNITEAFKYFEKTYEHDSFAQYALALSYYQGDNGYKVDYDKAFELCKLAVDGGNIEAIKLLAKFYYSGIGTKVDKELAQKYYQMAPKEGNLYDSLMGNSILYRNASSDYKKNKK